MKTRAAAWAVLILACCVYLDPPDLAADPPRMDNEARVKSFVLERGSGILPSRLKPG
jgi:hypothetical protein